MRIGLKLVLVSMSVLGCCGCCALSHRHGGTCEGAAGQHVDLKALIESIENDRGTFFESGLTKDALGNIVEICLVSEMVTDRNLALLSRLPTVRKLTLSCCAGELSSDSVKRFRDFKNLRSVVLYGAFGEIPLQLCELISTIDHLEDLTIEYSEIAREGVEILKEMKLTRLYIAESCTITD